MRMDFFSDLVEQALPESQAEIMGDGSKFEARIVSDSFKGMSTLKRHKLIYAILDEHIKTGAIHALSIKTYTKKEWAEYGQTD